jgi:AcrR family transcriptional regulator
VAVKQISTRERLIAAASSLLFERGLAGVTTQSVAEKAGVAEGTIYRHFSGRDALLLCAVRERVPAQYERVVCQLAERAGERTVEINLREFMAALIPFYALIAPMLGILAAHPALAAEHARALEAENRGPRYTVEQIAAYFRAEQQLGRIRPDADPKASAGLLLGVCFQRSLVLHLFGQDPTGLGDDQLPAAAASVLARGLVNCSSTEKA